MRPSPHFLFLNGPYNLRTVSTYWNNCEGGGGVEAGGKEKEEEAAVKQQ